MKVENGSLVLTVDGIEKTIELPSVSRSAKVKVWKVPQDYRADGLYVTVTMSGDPEEIPACSLSACELLGELDFGPSDEARLAAAKEAKLLEINKACSDAIAGLIADYPEIEVLSWPQQVKEAEALTKDPQAAVPLLTAIATARGLTVGALASRVLAKVHVYSAASGALIGRRQAAEDAIYSATTLEEVAAITF